jgi:hypothetical protein
MYRINRSPVNDEETQQIAQHAAALPASAAYCQFSPDSHVAAILIHFLHPHLCVLELPANYRTPIHRGSDRMLTLNIRKRSSVAQLRIGSGRYPDKSEFRSFGRLAIGAASTQNFKLGQHHCSQSTSGTQGMSCPLCLELRIDGVKRRTTLFGTAGSTNFFT